MSEESIYESDSEADSKYSELSSDTSDSDGSPLPSEHKPIQAHNDTIANIVDRLFGVSILIRGVSANFRADRAATHVERDTEGNDVLEEFKVFTALKIKWLCRETPQWLVDRLTDAIALRRRQFYYQRAHRRNLAGSSRNYGENSETATQTIIIASTLAVAESMKTGTTGKTYGTLPTEYDEQKATTNYVPLAPSEKRMGENIVPDPPKEPQGKPFECPQCFRILPAHTRDPGLWR